MSSLRAASVLALALTLAASTAPRTAHAADVQAAAARFSAGRAAYERGEYAAAATAFQDAYRIAPAGAAIFNAGLSWDAAEEPARAADALREALERDDLTREQRAEASEHLDQLASKVGRVVVTGPKGWSASVAHVRTREAPFSAYLRAGRHTIDVKRADGSTVQRSVTITAGHEVSLALDEEREPSSVKLDLAKNDASQVLLPVGIAAAGAGVVTAVAAGVFWSGANGARDDYIASGNRDAAARERADDLRTATNVSWVATGVLVATGAALLVVVFTQKPTRVGTGSPLAITF